MADAIGSDILLRHDRRPGDRELILTLHRQGYRDFDTRFSGPHLDTMVASVADMLSEASIETHPEHRVWFAERGGETLGCIALVRRGARGQLRWLIVLPEARGLGIGERLVDAVLKHARALRLSDIYLLTVRGLAASMALYERAGFEVTRDEEIDLWHGRGHEVEMRLAL